MKTILFLALSLLSLLMIEKSHACSMSIDQLYQKNLLVAYAASEMHVDLAKATSIAIADYTQSTYGATSGGACDTHLLNQARITVSYRPSILMTCSFSVTVKKREQIGIEIVDGPLIEVETLLPVSGCTSNPIILKPVPVPIPHP